MSTEVATQQQQSEDNNNNIDSNYDKSTEQTQEQQSSLDTPSRDSNATNSTINNGTTSNGSSGGATPINSEKAIDKIEETKIIKYSNMKSSDNPLTIAREKAKKEGRPLMVNFDERVVVHTVPYWDPCGETFYDNDDEDGPRGPNCCIIL